MIGDLISILFLVIIWVRLLKLKKENYSRFLADLFLYFFAFVFSLLFYKLFFNIAVSIFPEEIYPSIMGIFAAALVFTFILLKIVIFLLDKKRPNWKITEKIHSLTADIFCFIDPSPRDFNKVFTAFVLINIIIIATLFNSVFDVFANKKKLFVDKEALAVLMAKEQTLSGVISGNDNFVYNIRKAIEFIRLTNPHYYEKIIKNTKKITLAKNKLSGGLAYADYVDYNIVFDSGYGQRRYENIQEYLGLGMILVYESQHLEDYKLINGKDGFNFAGFIGGNVYFKIVCNPITNYENFIEVTRAVSNSYDEWCAQIEEVKFLRMYNLDYKKTAAEFFKEN